jgi:uncharacterized protein (TIGR02001 family)
LAIAGLASAQRAVPDLHGYLTLSSGYWQHGLAQNYGASLQLGIDYQHPSGFFTYARVANINLRMDYAYRAPSPDIEASAYVGYHDRGDVWSWTTSFGRYSYPDTGGRYDYDEFSASVGFRERVFYTASYSDAYYGRSISALNQEVSVAFPLRGNLEVGGALGNFKIAAGGPDITHWNVGVSKLVRRVAIDLRYYDGNYRRRSYLGDPNANHYVLSVSYAVGAKSPRTPH